MEFQNTTNNKKTTKQTSTKTDEDKVIKKLQSKETITKLDSNNRSVSITVPIPVQKLNLFLKYEIGEEIDISDYVEERKDNPQLQYYWELYLINWQSHSQNIVSFAPKMKIRETDIEKQVIIREDPSFAKIRERFLAVKKKKENE